MLYLWTRHAIRAHAAEVAERHAACPHPPEQQRTIRVNNILTMNPALLHAVLPGRRWLVKQCDRCGKQWPKYRGALQSFDEFMAEFDQETIDRAAQLQARTQAHLNELAAAERQRLAKRDRAPGN